VSRYDLAFNPDAVTSIGAFPRSLLKMEPRIRVHAMADDVEENKFMFVTKTNFHIPHGFPPIEHEIAHMVEMKDPARWTLPDLGMAIFPKGDPSPKMMFAAMAREIRVRAIQLHLIPEDQYSDGNHRTLFNILNNEHAWGGWARTMTPFGRFKNYQDVWDWANGMRERTFNAWNKDRIVHEWKIRLNHIQNWMETT
jgi:hypothetical protein